MSDIDPDNQPSWTTLSLLFTIVVAAVGYRLFGPDRKVPQKKEKKVTAEPEPEAEPAVVAESKSEVLASAEINDSTESISTGSEFEKISNSEANDMPSEGASDDLVEEEEPQAQSVESKPKPVKRAATPESIQKESPVAPAEQIPEPPREPTPEPVREPTPEPVREPTESTTERGPRPLTPVRVPTPEPVRVPTPEPVRVPTPEPVRVPTPEPVRVPTPEPVRVPTPEPVRVPTPEPVRVPTPEPVRVPTPEPVRVPTPEPVRVPTPEPVRAPTPPEPVRAPTPEPVRVPTPEPVRVPTPEPVRVPTPEPVRVPTPEPVRVPTPEPVRVPTPPEPVRAPTPEDSQQPQVACFFERENSSRSSSPEESSIPTDPSDTESTGDLQEIPSSSPIFISDADLLQESTQPEVKQVDTEEDFNDTEEDLVRTIEIIKIDAAIDAMMGVDSGDQPIEAKADRTLEHVPSQDVEEVQIIPIDINVKTEEPPKMDSEPKEKVVLEAEIKPVDLTYVSDGEDEIQNNINLQDATIADESFRGDAIEAVAQALIKDTLENVTPQDQETLPAIKEVDSGENIIEPAVKNSDDSKNKSEAEARKEQLREIGDLMADNGMLGDGVDLNEQAKMYTG